MGVDLPLFRLRILQASEYAEALNEVAPGLLDDAHRLHDRGNDLRNAATVEAAELRESVKLATFPHSRRRFAEEQIKRLEQLAMGGNPFTFGYHATWTRARSWLRRDSGAVLGSWAEMDEVKGRIEDLRSLPLPDGASEGYEAAVGALLGDTIALTGELAASEMALAYEAGVIRAHYQGYSRFPKSRLGPMQQQAERMERLALGGQP